MDQNEPVQEVVGEAVEVSAEEKQIDNRYPNRYKPGQSGNPNGRPPKGYSITETFKEMFNKEPEIKEKLVRKIYEKAIRGDTQAIKLLWNYMDGLPKQEIETNGDGSPIQIVIKRE